MSDDSPKVISFPLEDEHERARKLRVLVEWRAGQPTMEWELYLEGDAERHGIAPAKLRRMIQAVVKAREQKKREEHAIQKKHEQKGKKQAESEERKQSEEEKRAEREKREQAAEQRRVKREKEKRERALQALMTMAPEERETALRELAQQLDEDYKTLAAEFELRLAEKKERIRRGEDEPWPEPVDTRALLDDLTAQLERYVLFHQEEAVPTIALWIVFAWCHEVASYSPILVAQAPTIGSAKTHVCKVIALLTPRSKLIVEPTGTTFYRYVDEYLPTLIVDDADRLLPRRPDLTHIINSAYSARNAVMQRWNSRTRRMDEFNIFCPKVLNGIDLLAHLEPATRSRCITINMLRKLPNERVVDIRDADSDEAFPTLRGKLLRWSSDNLAALEKARPAMPTGYTNRLEDNYALLFAIADLAGGDWPKRARAAALKLTPAEPASLGERLLAAFNDLFVEHGNKLPSEKVPELLVASGDPEWADYRDQGHTITQRQVAALLKPFGIRPKHLAYRTQKGALSRVVRGYEVGQFETAFRHYLPGAIRKSVNQTKPPKT